MRSRLRGRAVVGSALTAVLTAAWSSADATAAWRSVAEGTGPGSTAAAQVTPLVTLTCSWNSSTKLLSVTIRWTKAGYARSTVTRISGSTRTEVATALAPSVTATTESGAVSSPGAGKSLTAGPLAYEVQAYAGDNWTRTGSSGSRTLTYTSGTRGAPDSCSVS